MVIYIQQPKKKKEEAERRTNHEQLVNFKAKQ